MTPNIQRNLSPNKFWRSSLAEASGEFCKFY